VPLIRLILVLISLAAPLRAEQVTVFAAASLGSALEELAPQFEQASGHQMVVSLAGSSVLARQISFGAPADLFISANRDWMDALQNEGLVQPEARLDLLGNDLVLIGQTSEGASIDGDVWQAVMGQRLAMALVDAVPAGIYGKAALENLDLWDRLRPDVVQTDNVRAALALVALGQVPFGIVYASDAQVEPRVQVLAQIPPDTHPEITYPMARLNSRAATLALFDWLQGAEAAAVFAAHGFTLRGEGGS
jgi:molybdate transport system substrate-binding protein